MLNNTADPHVLGYLGRALSLELSAVQQYSTQAKLAQAWGFADEAAKLQKESLEEMEHVERVIARMLALGVAPNASLLRPVKLGNSLPDLLKANLELENDLISLYRQATHHCARQGDHDNRKFFEDLLKEEQQHDAVLTSWIKSLESGATSDASRVTF